MIEKIARPSEVSLSPGDRVRDQTALQRLQEISVGLLGQLELGPLLESILKGVVDLLEADSGNFYRYDPRRDELHVSVLVGMAKEGARLVLKRGEGAAGKVLATGRPIRVDDYDSWEGRTPQWPHRITGPVIEVPVRRGDEFLGVLVAERKPGAQPFRGEDVDLLQLFANQAAVAIANARQYEEARRRADELSSLYETSLDLASQLEPQKLLESIVLRCERLVGGRFAEIVLYDPQAQELRDFVAHREGEPGFFRTQQVVKPGQGLDGRVFATGDPLIIDDYNTWEGRVRSFAPTPFPRMAAVPIKLGSETLGTLTVDRRIEDPSFIEEDLRLLQLFANQAAVAIANARLYEETRQRAQELSSLYETSLELTSQLEPQKLLEAIALRAERLLAGKFSQVVLYDPVRHELRDAVWVTRGRSHPVTEPFVTKPGEGLDGRVFLTGQPMVIENYNTWEGRLPNVRPLRAPRMAAVPIKLGNQILGTLGVRRLLEDPPFNEEELRLLTLFANQAAVALANAQQYQELQELYIQVKEKERLESELRVARTIQQSLLPQELPKIRGWEIAAFWNAARVISGDFYDVFPVPGGRWGFLIADVAGKGVPAALFMALCRSIVRTFCLDGRPPGEAIARANDVILADARTDWFVTLFYGLLDPKWGILTYVNAGHQRPLWYRRDLKQSEALKTEGMALGVVRGVALQERSLQMAPGDLVLLYTDGLSEAADPQGRFFGERRLRRLLGEMADDRPAASLARLQQEIVDFTRGREPSDDLTAILLRRTSRAG